MKKILLSSFIALGTVANAQCTTPITTFPASWDFEGVTAPALPGCWTVVSDGTANWNTWEANGNYGTQAGTNLLNYTGLPTEIASSWAFTPLLSLTAGHVYTVRFVSLANNDTNNTRILRVAYGSAATDAGMTNVLGTDDTLTTEHELKTYTFTAATSGNYYIGFNAYNTVPDATQTSVLIDDVVVNDLSLAVSDVNSNSKIIAYPNPVKDILKLSDTKGVKSISVIDMSGRQVKTLAPSNEINLSNLKAGNYIVSLKMENGTVQTINTIKK